MIIDKETITYHNVTITLTNKQCIIGKINITPKNRISDFINDDNKQFITLIESHSDDFKEKVIFINKTYILTCEPV